MCVHIQRTVWLNNGVPMKRHEHVRIPELLDMSEFRYQKQQKRPLPPATLDLDMLATGLLGGRARTNGFNKV